MDPVYVIADDLTGAADTGVCFTQAGLSVIISLSHGNMPETDVIVYSTESRNGSEKEARNRIRSVTSQILASGWVYKKIDSTLRGFPAIELAEIMAELNIEKALVAPAFPAQGRTTINGKQLIHGVPIEKTPFRQEVKNSDLINLFQTCDRPICLLPIDLLRSNSNGLRKALETPAPQLFIADAETDTDLLILADMAMQCGLRLFCGSAGLASALARCFPLKSTVNEPCFPHKQSGPILVIAGSRHPMTIEQVHYSRESGITVFELDHPDSGGTIEQTIAPVMKVVNPYLDKGQNVILTASISKDSQSRPKDVAEWLAQYALFFTCTQKIGGLVLTGGDTAMAVISALNATGVKLWGEFLPGIPLGTLLGGTQPDLPIITKAGGFGSKDTLIKAVQFLNAG